MDVRSQVSMVFHLDKCIGCHTCSIACKNIWTDRKGTEYMWWNNVETKPGTGFPTLWENQEKYKGGWEKKKAKLKLKLHNRLKGLANIFYNPHMPSLDDYYEPFTYQYEDLFNSPAGDDQPTARPVSMISGKPIDIEAGPNWDDDLSGSPIYAANDPNFENLTEAEKNQLFEIERMMFFYLPRICNHCLNPACVAACPSGAIYKRGEDGIVLVNQNVCRAWRMCVSSCPYKKVYYNWSAGKSEKCLLCYPRLETGQAPACFHSCVGRIRYLGVLLYDADRIEEMASVPDEELVEAQKRIILDPNDPKVITAAKARGIPTHVLKAAKKSPVYKFVKEWNLALPLHPEFRTLPMLFYVPPLLPVLASANNGHYENSDSFFSSLDNFRLPMKYLSRLLSAGNDKVIEEVYKKLMAVRLLKRSQSVGDVTPEALDNAIKQAQTTIEECEAIYKLTTLVTFDERFVIPPMAREAAMEGVVSPFQHKAHAGTGFKRDTSRRW